MEERIRVTVFTPTYNRDEYISDLYASLLAQSEKAFEWIIVDQGNDRTGKLAEEFMEKAPFPVIYHKLAGERGISRALNKMLTMARGELVIKVDDDDRLTPDAIESVLEMAATLPDKTHYAGVSGLKQYPDGSVIGVEWALSCDYVDCTNLERNRYGLEGDKAEAYFLEVLKEYGPMPTVPGEYFTWEEILWNRIADAGKLIRWFNRRIYIAEYHIGGASDGHERAMLESFYTYTLVVSERLKYRNKPFADKIKSSCRYFELFRKKDVPLRRILPYFSGVELLAMAGYIGSLFTKCIPRKDKRLRFSR